MWYVIPEVRSYESLMGVNVHSFGDSGLQLEQQSVVCFFLPLQGITYDTGGADIKAGGVMAGMHRCVYIRTYVYTYVYNWRHSICNVK